MDCLCFGASIMSSWVQSLEQKPIDMDMDMGMGEEGGEKKKRERK